VRPFLVVVPAEVLNLEPRVGDVEEPVRRETLVAKAAVEALDVRILDGFARPNEHELDAVPVRPDVEARETNSGPLSTTMLFGRPRAVASCSSAAMTRAAGSEVSTSMRGHSRVNSSTIVRQRKRRPLMQAS
jgi:hypothetical protein